MLQSNPSLLQQLGDGVGQLRKELEKLEKGKELDKLTQDEKTQKDTGLWKKWLDLYRYLWGFSSVFFPTFNFKLEPFPGALYYPPGNTEAA